MENNQVTELPDEIAVLVGSQGRCVGDQDFHDTINCPEMRKRGLFHGYLLVDGSPDVEEGSIVVLQRTNERPRWWKKCTSEKAYSGWAPTPGPRDIWLWRIVK